MKKMIVKLGFIRSRNVCSLADTNKEEKSKPQSRKIYAACLTNKISALDVKITLMDQYKKADIH